MAKSINPHGESSFMRGARAVHATTPIAPSARQQIETLRTYAQNLEQQLVDVRADNVELGIELDAHRAATAEFAGLVAIADREELARQSRVRDLVTRIREMNGFPPLEGLETDANPAPIAIPDMYMGQTALRADGVTGELVGASAQ
jgi:hypothetical protein